LVEKGKARNRQDAAEAIMGPNDWLHSAEAITNRQRKAEAEPSKGIDPLKAVPPLVADNALGVTRPSCPSPYSHKTAAEIAAQTAREAAQSAQEAAEKAYLCSYARPKINWEMNHTDPDDERRSMAIHRRFKISYSNDPHRR
jgi:hypothetical protein